MLASHTRILPAALGTKRLAAGRVGGGGGVQVAATVRTLFLAATALGIVGTMTQQASAANVVGGPLKCCCTDPMTGYYRDGFCRTGGGDFGVHVVCAQVTAEFLAFTASRGNDLSTPTPWGFPGLKPGDKWCLCVSRWAEAKRAGAAPPVLLASTHVRALDYVSLAELREHALDADEAEAAAAAAKQGGGAGEECGNPDSGGGDTAAS